MKKYKVWAYIERCEDDNYEDVSDPIIIGTFQSKDEAFQFADELYINKKDTSTDFTYSESAEDVV